jgi:hypothetical protein
MILIPQPLLPGQEKGSKKVSGREKGSKKVLMGSPSPFLGEGFRVRASTVKCTLYRLLF